MSVSRKNIRIFNKVVMVILEIKKDQFWCGKAETYDLGLYSTVPCQECPTEGTKADPFQLLITLQ